MTYQLLSNPIFVELIILHFCRVILRQIILEAAAGLAPTYSPIELIMKQNSPESS